MGFDETWRWRYEVARPLPSKVWNQLLNMIMERPFALNQEQLSMDAKLVEVMILIKPFPDKAAK